MALPPVRKTWRCRVNQQIAAQGSSDACCRALMLAYKQSLIGGGSGWLDINGNALGSVPGAWEVYGSNNGTTAAFDGVDRWQSVADINGNGITTQGSWIALRHNVSGLHMLLCMGLSTARAAVMGSVTGFGAAFGGTNGGINAIPTAVDGQASVTFGSVWGGPNTNVASALHVLTATDGTTFAAVMRGGVPHMIHIFASVTNQVAGKTYPQYFVANGTETTGLNSLWYHSLTTSSPWQRAWKNDKSPYQFLRYGSLARGSAGDRLYDLTAANSFSGKWPMIPLYADGDETTDDHLGYIEDFFFGLSNLYTVDYDDTPAAVRRWAQFGKLIVPWPGPAMITTPGGAEPARTIRVGDHVTLLSDVAPDTTPPTVTNFSAPTHPYDAARFDVLDPSLRAIMCVVGYGTDVPTEVVHLDADGLVAFAGPYTGTREAISGGYHYEVKHRRGWPTEKATRFRAIPIDTSGNLG